MENRLEEKPRLVMNIVRRLVRIGKSLHHNHTRETELYMESRNCKKLNPWGLGGCGCL